MEQKSKVIGVVIGTRPEAIKLAPVVLELRRRKIKHHVIHTRQHADTILPLLNTFGLAPTYTFDLYDTTNLNRMHEGLMNNFIKFFNYDRPTAMVVQGDTASALIGAIAAFNERIPVAHVEAGLRTYDLENPYPEEANRQMIDRISQWLFGPTKSAVSNLRAEEIPSSRIYYSGNTIVDAWNFINQKLPKESPWAKLYSANKLVLVTLHRRENESNYVKILEGIESSLSKHKEFKALFPMHPRFEQAVPTLVRAKYKTIHFIAPLSYPTFVSLLIDSYCVVTDSGGVQEEAAIAKRPVLIAREKTEREDIVGRNGVLIGTDSREITNYLDLIITKPKYHREMKSFGNPFGTGKSAKYIVDTLIQ